MYRADGDLELVMAECAEQCSIQLLTDGNLEALFVHC